MMKKLLLSLILTLVTVVTYGQEVVHDGVRYAVYDDKNLIAIVMGHTDNMPNEITILDEVSIEGKQYKVTFIADYAFYGCTNLASIDLSKSKCLKEIGKLSFGDCKSLISIDLSEARNLKTIGMDAFQGCENLLSIDISNSDNLTEIGYGAFRDCPNLVVVNMPKTSNSLKIGDRAFNHDGGVNLTFFNFPEGTISIGDEAFAENRMLKDIKFPESLEYIGERSFAWCYSLSSEDLIIPKNVKSIGADAFYTDGVFGKEISEFSLTLLPDTPPQLGENAISEHAIIYVPESNLSAYRNAWSKLHILPLNGALSLDVNVSQTGTLLSQIPRDKILDVASLKISGDINGTDIQVLNKCTNLQNLDLQNARIVSGGNKYYEDYGTVTNKLTENLFFGLKCLKSIILPRTLTSIEPRVFKRMYSLRHATLNQSLTSIGDEAFDECSLDTILIPKSVQSIGAYAFNENHPTTVIFEGFPKCEDCAFFNYRYEVPYCERSLHIPNIDGWFNMQFITDNFWGAYTNPLVTMRNLYANGVLITDLLIPSNVTRLGHYLFFTESHFNSVWVNSSNPPSIYEDTFWFSPDGVDMETVLYIPEGAEIDYWLHPIWGKFKQIRTFKPADLYSYTISHESIEIGLNESFQLGVVKPGGQAKNVEWVSSNNEVAYVNKCGLVTAMCDEGECVVTAIVDGQRLSCNVRVASHGLSRADNPKINPISIEFVSITTNPDVMNVCLYPVGASTVITWISDDPSLATIENGLITYHETDQQVRFVAITDNNQSALTPEITTVSGIEDIANDSVRPISSDVYNIQGICVKRNASLDDLKNLTPGFYIYQGQKFIVR